MPIRSELDEDTRGFISSMESSAKLILKRHKERRVKEMKAAHITMMRNSHSTPSINTVSSNQSEDIEQTITGSNFNTINDKPESEDITGLESTNGKINFIPILYYFFNIIFLIR